MLGLLLKTERSIQLYTLPMFCNQWSFELLLPFWSVTPSIRQFLHTLWLDIFSLWDHSANPRVGCGWSSELPRSPFFLILMLTFNFSSSSLLHPHSWTWLSCCHVVGWLFVWTFKLNLLPNEVAGEFVTTALAMKHVKGDGGANSQSFWHSTTQELPICLFHTADILRTQCASSKRQGPPFTQKHVLLL